MVKPALMAGAGINIRDARYPSVAKLRWEGEHAAVVSPAADGHLFAWTPPEPPPAGLMRYAERVAL
jgi:hypothetical protein